MKTKPILFSGPMVRAILEGRKTQTRRVTKPQPFIDASGNFCTPAADGNTRCWGQGIDGKPWLRDFAQWGVPYTPGDLLWVRETFAIHHYLGLRAPPEVVMDPQMAMITYLAGHDRRDEEDGPWTFSPSIHMPRWASRITLEVTDVRVERLQDISEEDAWDEGCEKGISWEFGGGYFPAEAPDPSGIGYRGWDCARDWFADLWGDLYDKRGFGWDANPWVVAVTFEPHMMNIDAYLEQKVAAWPALSSQHWLS